MFIFIAWIPVFGQEDCHFWRVKSVPANIQETTLDFKDVRFYAPTFTRMGTDEGLLRVLRRLPVLRDLSMQHLRILVSPLAIKDVSV